MYGRYCVCHNYFSNPYLKNMEQINTSLSFHGFIDSRRGGRRENQDSCGFIDTPVGLLIIVCDGMGGGPGGKIASVFAVETIVKEVQVAKPLDSREEIIIKAIKKANRLLYQKSCENKSLSGMGSTVTVLLISDYSAVVAHVGDSRIYQFRRGCKIFRTFDHSMVFELVKQKVLTEEQARLSAESNLITRALGIKPDVEVDIQELAYEKGDRFMVCSDGVWGSLTEKELIKMATNSTSLYSILDSIILKVDELGVKNGGTHDNLTAALIETKSNSKLKEKMSTPIRNVLIGLTVVCFASIVCNVVQFSKHSAQPDESSISDARLDSISDEYAKKNAELEKKIEEERDLREAFEKEVSDLIKKNKMNAEVFSKLKAKEKDKEDILAKLDTIIEQLGELKTKGKSDEKNNQIAEVTLKLEELRKPLVDKYGVADRYFYIKKNGKIGGAIGFLQQKVAQEDDGVSQGHYDQIIKLVKEIKGNINKSKI